MSGILGGWWLCEPADFKKQFDIALEKLRYCGPGGNRLEKIKVAGGSLVLGQTGLSTMALTPTSSQPLQSIEGRYTIVCDATIYNYPELRGELRALGHDFRTGSQAEVLLAAWTQWGQNCLRQLTGMFAFAVFDRQERSLTLVRDGFGIKPLFYHLDEKGFWFASELPALLAVLPSKPAIDLQSAYDYLVWGSYDHRAETFYEGIARLLPSQLLTLPLNTMLSPTATRWWQPNIEERSDLSFSQAAEKLRAMFLQNVRLHLRSDATPGIALSGGIDSSSLVCAMRHLEPDMPINTISFVARNREINEERWADLVNAHVGAVAHKLVIESKELADDIDDMIRSQAEPFGSSSIYAQYRVFKLAREQRIVIILDGQGGDELLAGNIGYNSSFLRSLLERKDSLGMITFMIHCLKNSNSSRQLALKTFADVMLPPTVKRTIRKHQCRSMCQSWINADYFRSRNVVMELQVSKHTPAELGRRLSGAMRTALTAGGLEHLIRHGSRNSMRWSVENRLPFLTVDMAEFLLSLPEAYHLSPQGETKHLFRAAMRGIVPDLVLNRSDKIGFETPEHEWLIKLRRNILFWLDAAEDIRFLNAKECKAEVASILGRKKGLSQKAWRLINFCRWMQLH